MALSGVFDGTCAQIKRLWFKGWMKAGGGVEGWRVLTPNLVTCLHFQKTSRDMYVDDVESLFELDGGALGSH